MKDLEALYASQKGKNYSERKIALDDSAYTLAVRELGDWRDKKPPTLLKGASEKRIEDLKAWEKEYRRLQSKVKKLAPTMNA